MLFKTMCHLDFATHAVLMDTFLQPIEYGINFLFSRSKIQHMVSNLGSVDPQQKEHIQRSQAKFLRVTSGDFGKDLMNRYVRVLEHELAEAIDLGIDLSSRDDLLRLGFQLAVVGITDSWRRLVLECDFPPFSLFKLTNLPTDSFVTHWRDLHAAFSECSSCFDDAFSAVLLNQFPMTEFHDNMTLAHREDVVSTIKALLLDVAAWAPLSSDLVEIKNGIVQWVVSRRGRQFVKGVNAARETTMLQASIRQFMMLQQEVERKTLPPKMQSSGILKMSGVSATNQYSKEPLTNMLFQINYANKTGE